MSTPSDRRLPSKQASSSNTTIFDGKPQGKPTCPLDSKSTEEAPLGLDKKPSPPSDGQQILRQVQFGSSSSPLLVDSSPTKKQQSEATMKPTSKAPKHHIPSPNFQFKSFFLPLQLDVALPTNTIEAEYEGIQQQLSHPALKHFGDSKDRDVNWDFPRLSSAGSTPDWFALADFQRLALDPSAREDDSKFYCSYQVLDLFTQWTFRGMKKADVCLPAPARLFDCVLRAKASKSKDIDTVLNSCLSQYMEKEGPNAFFEKRVFSMTVWGGVHFSKVFVLNASKVLNRAFWNPNRKETDPAPCIVYSNSTENSRKTHNPTKVAEVVRYLFNAVDQKINKSAGKHFNLHTLPVYELAGKRMSPSASAFVLG